MTDQEQTELLRAVFERLCCDTLDPHTIGRRALAMSHVLDCPCSKRTPPSVLAKRLCVSRQSIYAKIDKFAYDLAEIKGDLMKAG